MTLRERFREIKFLRDNGVHKGGALKDLYDEEVKILRRILKQSEQHGLCREIIVKQWDDGIMIRFPIGQWSDKETAESVAEKFSIAYVPTYYDCTGQLFTSWQSVHYMAGEYWLWQCNCLDV